jgi:hypothetical protein
MLRFGMDRPKPWPAAVVVDAGKLVECARFYDRNGQPIDNTTCKHGDGECEVCGTTGQRDVRHSTKCGV